VAFLTNSSTPGPRTPNSCEEDSSNNISFLFLFEPDFSVVILHGKRIVSKLPSVFQLL
jgi:hypothetical protein